VSNTCEDDILPQVAQLASMQKKIWAKKFILAVQNLMKVMSRAQAMTIRRRMEITMLARTYI
jgi:hypothetical protein